MTTEEVNQLLKELFDSRLRFERTLSQKQKQAFNNYWDLLQEMPLYASINAVESLQEQVQHLEKTLNNLKNSEKWDGH